MTRLVRSGSAPMVSQVTDTHQVRHETNGSDCLMLWQEYDYVFTIDINEGGPSLKLPYNVCEDPWLTAHNFLQKNDLSPMFLDQVANFITENSKGHVVGPSQPGGADPFTGESQMGVYTNRPCQTIRANVSVCILTGGARYVPGASDGSSGFGADPFTGKLFPHSLRCHRSSCSHATFPPCRLRPLHPRIGSRPRRSSGRGRPIHR